jgi:hypothetical protein
LSHKPPMFNQRNDPGYDPALDGIERKTMVHGESAGFLERIRPLILSRPETELAQRDQQTWVLKEAAVPYGARMGSKNAPKKLRLFIVWSPQYDGC